MRPRIAILGAALLVAACSKPGTYVVLDVSGGAGAPAGTITRVDLDFTLGGQHATAKLEEAGMGVISLPTDAVFEVKSGEGSITVDATARNAAGATVTTGHGSGTVTRGQTTHVTLVLGDTTGTDGGIEVDLLGVDLTGADLTMPTVDLLGVDLTGADLTEPPDMTQTKPDMGGLPMLPTTFLRNGDFTLWGVTDDGYAVVTEAASRTAMAIPLDGTAPQTIMTYTNEVYATVKGNTAFIWDNVDFSNFTGDISAWTQLTGPRLHVGSQSQVGYADTTGVYVAFSKKITGTFGDVSILNLANNTSTDVLTQQNAFMTFCPPTFGFAGMRAFFAFCPPAATTATVITTKIDGTAPITLMGSGALTISVPTAGNTILVIDAMGGALVYPSGGGPGVTVGSGISSGLIGHHGNVVVLVSQAGDLRMVDLMSMAQVTLLASAGIKGIHYLSPDDRWVLYYTISGNQPMTDLHLSSVTTAGTKIPLNPMPTSAPYQTDLFTTDSRYVLFNTNFPYGGISSFNTASGVPTLRSSKTFLTWSGPGSSMSYSNNYVPMTGGMFGRGDILFTDLTTDTTSVAAVAADGLFFPSFDRTLVVYTSHTAMTPGLYTTRVK